MTGDTFAIIVVLALMATAVALVITIIGFVLL